MIVKTDCKFFRGDVPCKPHKQYGYHCVDCPEYKNSDGKILIIKLGAIGDVIRTTPLLRKLRAEFPNYQFFWLTYTPEILSSEWVNRILHPTIENLELLKNIEFNWLINLDKDALAVSLANSINAKRKSGFTIDEFGHAKPISNKAEHHKWLTGLFDDVSKENTKNYMQEIFEICDYEFSGEEYVLELPEVQTNFDINKNKKVIGLNTGCGGRWTSRLWPTEYWIELAKNLLKENYEVILLGGEQENEKNKFIQKESGAKYFGYFNLQTFMNLVNNCDIVVTAVTMAMHIAIGLKKKLILFNNIFNKNEFYLYGRGKILEPDFECDCYYSPTCENSCMQYLKPERVLETIRKFS
ncbi:glycosyltransferase family 9 protein [Melioribacteraceae bacterium 4301-Me]|uniref:glycosyltransferase family 9 protein n=1 Tax=Pyranulibacter aquaticus TaxID=3163344 RepID=UPI003595CB45